MSAAATSSPAPTRYESVDLMDKNVEEAEVRAGSAHAKYTNTGTQGQRTNDCTMRFSQDTNTNAADCQMTSPFSTLGVITVHLIVLPDGVFMQFPKAIEVKLGGPWLKANTASKDAAAQELLQMQKDLAKSADMKDFMPPGSRITSTADEQLDGTPVTRYEITADAAAAAKQATDSTTQGEFADLIKAGVATVQTTVWIDAQNYPRKLHATLPLSKLGKKGVVDEVKEVTFDRWGEPVSITAPPADQVTLFPKK